MLGETYLLAIQKPGMNILDSNIAELSNEIISVENIDDSRFFSTLLNKLKYKKVLINHYISILKLPNFLDIDQELFISYVGKVLNWDFNNDIGNVIQWGYDNNYSNMIKDDAY